MKYINIYFWTILFLFVFPPLLEAYNKPYIINFSKSEYGGDNKNWSIDQDEKGVVYFGNDIGLLEFDGIGWSLNKLDNNDIVRSVGALSHNLIFTGGYEEFGRWDRDISGNLKYTSLSSELDKSLLKNDDFWKIWANDKFIYFQSFNSIFIYDYKTVERIPTTRPILFLTKVRDQYWVQEIGGDLFSLKGKSLKKIQGDKSFSNTEVRVILPFSTNEYLVGTSTKGLYIYNGANFREWNSSLSKKIGAVDLNCGILTSYKTYVFGTILDGIYEVDLKGNIVNHISTDNMLQNNTVLSLSEDVSGNIWAGLDRGISYIQYLPKMSYYMDPRGNIGSSYGALLWGDNFFLGTNQGVFYINKNNLSSSNALSNMKLVDGTQGQVWSLHIVDDRLYCCHNRGFKEIHRDLTVSDPYNIGTGVFGLTEAKLKNREVILLSTYSSVRLLDKETGNISNLDQVREPIIVTEVDHLENVWFEQLNKGVYRSRLSDDLGRIESYNYYDDDNNSNNLSASRMKIFKAGGRIVLLADNQFYLYDDISDKIVSNELLNTCFQKVKDLKQIIPIQGNLFWALTGSSIYKFSYDGYNASIVEAYNIASQNLSLVNSYENISVLNDSLNVICLDNGFLLYNDEIVAPNFTDKLDVPFIKSFQTTNQNGNIIFKDILGKSEISFDYNSIIIRFSSKNTLASNYKFQYMLMGVDKNWSAPNKINQVSYARLPKGRYTFMLRTVDNLGNSSDSLIYEFEILSPWYQTVWAYLMYAVLVVVIFILIWIVQLRHYQKKQLAKIRVREEKRLRYKNEHLEQVVEEKNAELLTQTSFLIQRNELIFKIREELESYLKKQKDKSSVSFFEKINVLLNDNVNAEEDWKMFLINFEQKHSNFFKKLKEAYPQLTANDLKLCACLKLNLVSKDIASLMNISVRAVENSRSRLRKKLNIESHQALNDFFMQF